ncbi:hypothetical protein [Latilactobacillus sakei]|uniref:hypothetical protein n=1 Tax=Latilactobacillus sakei TaxID=1599 RepID=UPI000DBB49D2|nr:hypothetical protein [Latilactobacillus sakei]BBE27166.1 hypothetical protein NFHkm12_19920 [Latilactobacillus curvatus]
MENMQMLSNFDTLSEGQLQNIEGAHSKSYWAGYYTGKATIAVGVGVGIAAGLGFL